VPHYRPGGLVESLGFVFPLGPSTWSSMERKVPTEQVLVSVIGIQGIGPVCPITACLLLCSRLNPKNVHQRPTVALLCGPHVKGAQGISCGRHLANHDVQVILFLPNFVKMLESITNELSLFSKTQGQQVSSLRGEHQPWV
jgi:hypothetical protein